jgi:Rps23 Pro-64 3,4-dihydroxylase Tpa1-like proline 4-hydroxylase
MSTSPSRLIRNVYRKNLPMNTNCYGSTNTIFLALQLLYFLFSFASQRPSVSTSYRCDCGITLSDAFMIHSPTSQQPHQSFVPRQMNVILSSPRLLPQQRRPTRIEMTSMSSSSSTTITPVTTHSMILSNDVVQQLHQQGYVILPNFINQQLQYQLREDIQTLREREYFKKANIGQDSTNTYNSTVRITETCFIGKDKHRFNTMERNEARETLYNMVDDIGKAISSPQSDTSLSTTTASKPVALDDTLTELLYAYYPNGGYYRTHMDAIPNSISYLRQYSFLLYLNGGSDMKDRHSDWNTTTDGGQLRLYLNRKDNSTTATPRTLDFTNDLYQKEYDTILDVTPSNGTLVLFDSHTIPHEVLNTYRERYVIIGWFNRPPSLWNDYTKLTSPVLLAAGDGGSTALSNERVTLLVIAMGMIAFGIYNLMVSL